MIRAVLPFNTIHLRRRRYIELNVPRGPAPAVPDELIYAPIHHLAQAHSSTYPFRMFRLLHVAGLKMLQPRRLTMPSQTLVAAGGLYMALDQDHPDLAYQDLFGDFTSGFSHQFGVALATMIISEAYGVAWDSFVPIAVRGRKVLDYIAPLGGNEGYVQLEAKGVAGSPSAARSDIIAKKVQVRSTLSPQFEPCAMLGVIVSAGRPGSRRRARGRIDIVDPAFGEPPDLRNEALVLANKYLHYVGVALFAGLYSVADELLRRAKLLLQGSSDTTPRTIIVEEASGAFRDWGGLSTVGVQWRLGLEDDPAEDTWFHHGVDLGKLRPIVEKGIVFEADSFHDDRDIISGDDDNVVSVLPDGSIFGISRGPRDGLVRFKRGSDQLSQLDVVRIQ
ncbi:hypothetical protein EYB53_019975 [Candidatus Chloroploca sp. M-50]|uniref:Uncharacterized protein n=1 Tax=Candidatus Chloroploca mongolica TaxID=2528176 RepID=A0ABS4DEX3_9CHLR|nr:hypothetical protein [Candidatus Chloroploca mongolica]MBP1468006.1 hypothetical protein [Candidatus Chloroploca mongolica]